MAGRHLETGKLDCRFPRSRRILSSLAFRRVYESGRVSHGKFLVFWFLERGDGETRVGVVASRRSFRKAVDRARAKRLLREAFRLNCGRLRPGFDCVLIARKTMLGASGTDVEAEFLRLARGASILEKEVE
ncbi:MAG: ribonuclease P protein component [Lentisphaerae bacterium]|nr:ribonuclease P protein component [Lentisphaerota bacterium]